MLLIIDQVSTEASTVKAEIEKQEENLRKTCESTFPSIESSIKDTVSKFKEKLLSIKLKKYKRDTEDYLRNEIYHWESKERVPSSQTPDNTQLRTGAHRPRGAHRQASSHRRVRDNHTDSSMDSDFTFDSDSGFPPSNPSFLSNRKKPGRGLRNADGANTYPNTRHRPWTRSNSRTR